MGRKRYRRIDRTPVEVTVESLSHEGRGIATIDGKKVFIDCVLPGEQVSFIYTRKKKSYDEAKLDSLINSSEKRVTPPCQHFGVCGGCSMQHLSLADQIAHKQSVLIDHLKHYAGIELSDPMPPIVASHSGYRRKTRLGVKFVEKKGGILIGFREKHQPNLITHMQQCEILHPSITKLLPSLSTLIGSLSIPSQIPQIEAAVGDDHSSIVFRHLEALTEADLDALKDYGKTHQIHIYTQSKGLDTVKRLWPEDGLERLHYDLPDFNLRMAFHPNDFTQVNADINRLMLNKAIELLDPQKEERILDLFCGLGNFTLPIARHCDHAIGVEVDDDMVQRAKDNAVANDLDNVEFYRADLNKDFATQAWARDKFAKILLDPPRTGALEVIKHFPKLEAWRIVYVSCNPATLARDADELQKQGYQLIKAGVMDMFPHTSHVESIALFERR